MSRRYVRLQADDPRLEALRADPTWDLFQTKRVDATVRLTLTCPPLRRTPR